MTFFPCCCETTGGSSAPDECCTLAGTLLAGNVTGGTNIVVSTGDQIAGETDLDLSAAVDVTLAPTAGSAFVNGSPIITGAANAGAPSDADIFQGLSTPSPTGTDILLRRLTAGANVTITQGVDDITIAATGGGGVGTWAQVLATGDVSGGTDPVISTGDSLRGQTDLPLLAGGNAGNWSGIAADATAANNGGQVLLRSGAGGGGNDGGFLDIIGGNGDGSGSGARAWMRGGQGGPTNGQGGVGRLSGGQGTAAGDGGLGLLEGGPASAGQGGIGRVAGGSANGAPGEAQVLGGSALVEGNGADARVTGGSPASAIAAARAGGNVRLVPTAGINGGTNGTAFVGNQSIITTLANAGGGAAIALAKTAGGINGAQNPLRTLTSTGGTIAITEGSSTINLESAGSFSSGSEIRITVQGIGSVASTVRQTTVRGRQSVNTQVSFNLAAGTADVTLEYRSLVAGQTTTMRARNIWGRSNLGNTRLDGLTTVITNNTTTFAAAITINVDAGNWVITCGADLEPPP